MRVFAVTYHRWFRLPNDPDEKDCEIIIVGKYNSLFEAEKIAKQCAEKDHDTMFTITLWDDEHPIESVGTLNIDLYQVFYDKDDDCLYKVEHAYGMKKPIYEKL